MEEKTRDFMLFRRIIIASLANDIKELKELQKEARDAVEKFRPKEEDYHNVKVIKMKLKALEEGRYNMDEDCIYIDTETENEHEVLQHELTHRKIQKEVNSAIFRILYNLMTDFADNEIAIWLFYYTQKYIISEINLIKKIFDIE